jgi:hypothetical protein
VIEPGKGDRSPSNPASLLLCLLPRANFVDIAKEVYEIVTYA